MYGVCAKIGPSGRSINRSASNERQPHISGAASSLSREKSTLAAVTGANTAVSTPPSVHDEDSSAKAEKASAPEPDLPPPPPPTIATTAPEAGGEEANSRSIADSKDDGDDHHLETNGSSNSVDNSNSGSDGGSDDNDACSGGTAGADNAAGDEGKDEAPPRRGAGSRSRSASIVARARDRAAKAWSSLEVGVERAIHVRREVKAVFSSELERCLLKVRLSRTLCGTVIYRVLFRHRMIM